MIAVDTNLLVYAHRAGAARQREAAAALRAASAHAEGWGYALPVAAEFWRVVTHAAAPGGPSRPAQAAEFLQALAAGGAVCWLPLAGFEERLWAGARALGLRGAEIFDLQIGLMALEGGAREIWTYDRAFVQLPGLKVRAPGG